MIEGATLTLKNDFEIFDAYNGFRKYEKGRNAIVVEIDETEPFPYKIYFHNSGNEETDWIRVDDSEIKEYFY